jgi:S1-C subfamily serine protease
MFNRKEDNLSVILKYLFPTLLFSLLLSPANALFGTTEAKDEKVAKAILKEAGALLEYEKNTISIFKKSVKSVVNVSNIVLARRGGFFDFDITEIPAGQGSGWVWDNKGHIVTNYHVIAKGDNFLISFHKDPKQYKAKIVGAEPRKDIAVLKLTEIPKNLHPVKLGSSKGLQVGQKATAIGNPFGLDHTVTTGIVSATGRKISGVGGVKIHNMIQTDTSINPGNSGGPLFDSSGNVIGMNTMIFSHSGSSAGVGFAVPIDSIKRIVPQLINNGEVKRPALGIGLLEDRAKDYFGIKKGIVIKFVYENSPAKKIGLKGMGKDRYGRYHIGDIIHKIDGKEVNNYDDIYHALDKYKIGDEVEVHYLRKNKIKKAKLKLTDSSSVTE